MIPQVPPGLSMVNPQLADILQGYKNALDAALMATKLISGSSHEPPSRMRQEPRRTDGLEVCGTICIVIALTAKNLHAYKCHVNRLSRLYDFHFYLLCIITPLL